jgi:hypothetical protein
VTGSRPGDRRRLGGPLDVFLDDEGGYTSVAVAVALLLSLTLVFAAASAQWVTSRSAEVQEVADATAMAGQNAVAAYSTVAQVVDACVLSMGLAGLVTYGAGMVASCVPGASAAAAPVVETGAKILDARRSFAKSASEGLQKLEEALPTLVVANSASCVTANSTGGISYVGCALPFPMESKSDFSALGSDADDSEMEELSQKMREASDKADQSKKAADEAREKAWRADCIDDPCCMRERAASLAGMSGDENPNYASAESWTFGVALQRARTYYARRLSSASVGGSTAEELTDAACRKAFYAYALDRVNVGSYEELPDGTVSVSLPELPHNTEETRATTLYTDSLWPCTNEAGGRTLHCSLSCPGAKGASSGTASLAELESGGVATCVTCGMDVGDMGRVAAASTSIDNGFEHYWRIVVEASRDYQSAMDEYVQAKATLKELAKQGKSLFEQALDALTVARPTLCPPGAYGCVALVYRQGGTAVPDELTRAFLSAGELPAGIAVSAATLAPDDSTAENNILASFLDGLSADESFVGGVADGVLGLWGRLLVSYGSAYESVGSAGGDFLDKVDGVLGGTAGSWLKEQIKEVMSKAGLEPADMRLKKPVLTNSQKVLEKAGYDQGSTLRSLVEALPDSGSAWDYARSVGIWAVNTYGDKDITVAELTIPGTDVKIPLTINLAELVGSS